MNTWSTRMTMMKLYILYQTSFTRPVPNGLIIQTVFINWYISLNNTAFATVFNSYLCTTHRAKEIYLHKKSLRVYKTIPKFNSLTIQCKSNPKNPDTACSPVSKLLSWVNSWITQVINLPQFSTCSSFKINLEIITCSNWWC